MCEGLKKMQVTIEGIYMMMISRCQDYAILVDRISSAAKKRREIASVSCAYMCLWRFDGGVSFSIRPKSKIRFFEKCSTKRAC